MSSPSFIHSFIQNARFFDQDLSRWNIERVTDMTEMFQGASSFGQTLCWNISSPHLKKVDRLLAGTKPTAKVDEHVSQCTRDKTKLYYNNNPAEAAAIRQDQSWSLLLVGMVIMAAVVLLWLAYQYCFLRRCCRRNKKIVIKKTTRRKRRKRQKTGIIISNSNNPDLDEEVFFGETDAEVNLQEVFHRQEEFYRSQKQQQRESVHFLDEADEGEISFEVNSDGEEAEEDADDYVADAAHPSLFADGFLFSQHLLSLLGAPPAPSATTEEILASEESTMEGLSLQARNQKQDEGVLC
jgi:Mycoplasma protein of unknown function, DUF285